MAYLDKEMAEEMNKHQTAEKQFGAMCRIANKRADRIAALEKSLDAVYAAGMKGIGYVAAANYPEREQEAIRNLQKAYDAVLKGAK